MLVCSKHHRALHEGGYTLTREGEELVFRSPCGTELEPAPESPAVAWEERAFADIPTLPTAELAPGEYLTNRDNRERSLEWLLQQ